MSTSTATRDEDFYFSDLVIFLVESKLFKVPKLAFEMGSKSFFGALFTLPPPKEEITDGQSDAQPIRLDGIDAKEFKIFLRALYPNMDTVSRVVSNYRNSPGFHFTRSEYITILKLSTMWDFEELREATIKRLTAADKMSGFDLFLYGVTYHIDEWKLRGLDQLLSRDAPLLHEEAKFMNSTDENLLWKYLVIRECCRNKSRKVVKLPFSCSCPSDYYNGRTHQTTACCREAKMFPKFTNIVHAGDCDDARKQLGLDVGSEPIEILRVPPLPNLTFD